MQVDLNSTDRKGVGLNPMVRIFYLFYVVLIIGTIQSPV